MFITLVFGVSLFGASTFAVAIGQMTDPADIWEPEKPPFSMERVRNFLGAAWLCFILAIAVAGFSSSLLTLLKHHANRAGVNGQKMWKTITITTSVLLWTLLAVAFLFLSLAMVPYAYIPGWIAVASAILFSIGMACLLCFQVRAHFTNNRGILLLTSISYFAIKLYQQRVWFRRTVKKYNLPTLPGHSWLLGNLIAVGKIMVAYPADVHGQLMPDFLAREYPDIAEFGVCYIDLWPVSWPMMATFHPEIAAQFTQETSRPKHEIIRGQFRPLTGLKDLVLAEGSFWKKWRTTFNPGFSTQNISALVPKFIEEASTWKKHLQQVAKEDRVVRLEDSVMKATCDIIGRSVLGQSLGIQSGVDDKIFPTLKGAIALLVTDWSPPNWSRLLDPFRGRRLASLNQKLRSQLKFLIESQLENHASIQGPKTVNGLAIRTYLKDTGKEDISKSGVDTEFLDVTIENLKIFLFAGHDTTASTLCFAYNYLHHHPDVLAKLRKEHDEVLGPDPNSATSIISESPTILNQLVYTTAIIKETLCLEPPIGSCREGSPTFFLRHPETGQQLPTDGFILFSASKAIHRNPKFWPNPDKFMPERWLEQDFHRTAYRPFELGPRGCIGQELALTELRLLLAMTVRDLEIVPAYKDEADTLYGYQAFQAHMPGELTAHPSKGMPVRVRLRKV
ncbi:unnamed protein product [Fusarium graminearum]|nr:unnamed protein product [Fusarium graminearum]